MAERLVPDELWELFQRVVPEARSRPQGGGRRRHGDREVLAAIVSVATSGCTWQQLPTTSVDLSGVTAHQRFSGRSEARVRGKFHRVVRSTGSVPLFRFHQHHLHPSSATADSPNEMTPWLSEGQPTVACRIQWADGGPDLTGMGVTVRSSTRCQRCCHCFRSRHLHSPDSRAIGSLRTGTGPEQPQQPASQRSSPVGGIIVRRRHSGARTRSRCGKGLSARVN